MNRISFHSTVPTNPPLKPAATPSETLTNSQLNQELVCANLCTLIYSVQENIHFIAIERKTECKKCRTHTKITTNNHSKMKSNRLSMKIEWELGHYFYYMYRHSVKLPPRSGSFTVESVESTNTHHGITLVEISMPI